MERIFLLRTFFSVVAATGILTAPAFAQKEKDPVVVTGAVEVTNTVDVNVVSPDSNGGGVDASNVESFFCSTKNITVPVEAVCTDQITVNAPVAISWFNAALFNISNQGCRLIVSVNGIGGGTPLLFQMLGGNTDTSAENASIIYPKPLLLQAGDIIQFEVQELFGGTGTCRGYVSFPLEPRS